MHCTKIFLYVWTEGMTRCVRGDVWQSVIDNIHSIALLHCKMKRLLGVLKLVLDDVVEYVVLLE